MPNGGESTHAPRGSGTASVAPPGDSDYGRPMSPAPRRPTPWSHARGALLLSALLINLCQGAPVPSIDAASIDRPSNRARLERYGRLLRSAGVSITDDELREKTLEVSSEVNRWHGVIIAPVHPTFHYLQIRQRWSLFAASDTDPWWIHVEGKFRGDEEYQLIWRPMDTSATVEQATLEYRRLRGVWNPGEDVRADQPRFLRFLHRLLFHRYPDLAAIRVRYLRFHVHVPGTEPPNQHQEWGLESEEMREESEWREMERAP